MEDLILALKHAPDGEPVWNSTIGAVIKLWKPIVDEWMRRQDAQFLRTSAPDLARKAMALAAAYASSTTKAAKLEIRRYVERSQWKGRKGDVERGSCIAWLNSILAEAGRPLIRESRKELPWTHAVRIIRFLEGDHPEHEEYSEAQVEAALRERIDQIQGWLSWEESWVLAWEAKSRERRQPK